MKFNSNHNNPPELYPTAVSSVTQSVQTLHLDITPPEPQRGFTENHSLTYLATQNPCLDFFFHVVPDTPAHSLIERLTKSWSFDPLTTLKLISNLRGVRGTGKSDKEGFYVAALWLHKNHPQTLARNVRIFAQFGYYKDLVEILRRLIEGEDARMESKESKSEWKSQRATKGGRFARTVHSFNKRQGGFRKGRKLGPSRVIADDKILNKNLPGQVRIDEEREKTRVLRKEKVVNKAKKAYESYSTDPVYRFLHDSIADMFAEELKKDLNFLNSNEVSKISLASKWCPSIDSSYDKSTLICENIARRVFPKDSDPQYEGIPDEHYAYRVRDRLRKQVLVPLRKALELPEVYMGANQWQSLPYNKVASVAMKNYKGHFLKHDRERFEEYLDGVKFGEGKISAGALLPHEIIDSLKDGDEGLLAEMQWKTMVEDMLKAGKLKNCIAVCDVSESMYGTPMDVSVSLGLLISELSEVPWKGKVITFHENPKIHLIKGSSLLEKTKFIRELDMGDNADLQNVFDRILKVAVADGLSEEQMIKKIFVFSDMEFGKAFGSYSKCSNMDTDIESKSEKAGKTNWKTDYEDVKMKFREKGYTKVPEIVFWNLRDSPATPVLADQSGVELVSGFSKNMMKFFLGNEGILNPLTVMSLAISGELYEKLIVYD